MNFLDRDWLEFEMDKEPPPGTLDVNDREFAFTFVAL